MDAKELTLKYLKIKKFVIDVGFTEEITFYDTPIEFENIDEHHFIRELAWVILNSGMRNTVIAKVFPSISEAFCGWNLSEIIRRGRCCIDEALKVFNSRPKIEAIFKCCIKVHNEGIAHIKNRLQKRGVEYLREFPYIGPVICYHLAKNLGYDCVKPDRHLSRMSEALGYKTPFEMCEVIRNVTGDKLAVIDVVLWRYATLDENYIDFLIA